MDTTLDLADVLITPSSNDLTNFDAQAASAVIWSRKSISALQNEVEELINGSTFSAFNKSGKASEIISEIKSHEILIKFPELIADVENLIKIFSAASGTQDIRFELSAVVDDRCRKFHTDITDYRMLCTYAGPGTLYVLPKDSATVCKCNECDIDPLLIHQTEVFDSMIFRGALSSSENISALLHKSPPVEKSGEKRLLLRIDTNGFANF
jgi:hypothetical protein